jgi:hypothetical protein
MKHHERRNVAKQKPDQHAKHESNRHLAPPFCVEGGRSSRGAPVGRGGRVGGTSMTAPTIPSSSRPDRGPARWLTPYKRMQRRAAQHREGPMNEGAAR